MNLCNFCKNPECEIPPVRLRTSWEHFKDYFFFENIAFTLIALALLTLFFGWWGILWTLLLKEALLVEGGNFIDLVRYPEPEPPKNICSAGISDCQLCDNPYSHEFNVKHYQSLKWWEKMI